MTPNINYIARRLRTEGFSFHHRRYCCPSGAIIAQDCERRGKIPPEAVLWYRPEWVVPSPIGGKRVTLQIDPVDVLVDDENKIRAMRDRAIEKLWGMGFTVYRVGMNLLCVEGV